MNRLRFLFLAIALLLPQLAAAQCAALPNTWPAWAGSLLKIENSVRLNGVLVTAAEHSGSFGINASTATVQAAATTMPTMDPAAYPTIGSGSTLTNPASVAPGTYTAITVGNTAATPDTVFAGGSAYFIQTLTVAASAQAQLAPGDYYIRTLSLGAGAQITVAPGGPVRIFVNSNMTWGNGAFINDGGSAANLRVYMYSGATLVTMGNNVRFTGVMIAPLAGQSIIAGTGSVITGALLAQGTLTLKDSTTLNYDVATQGQVGSVSTCNPSLLARYRYDEASWGATAGAVQDSSGFNRHATAIGSTLPTTANTLPARAGDPGTCRYGVFTGPFTGGGAIQATGLPVNTVANLRNSVAFWLYYSGSGLGIAMGWYAQDLYYSGGLLGFNSFAGDWLYTSVSGAARWMHVVAIFTNGDQSKNELYIDGVKRSLSMSGTANNGNAYAASTMYIGGVGIVNTYRLAGANVDEVHVYSGTLSQAMITALYNETHPCSSSTLHHLEISDSTGGNGLTCIPSTLTVRACANAACSSLYTGGVAGTLTATAVTGSPTANWGGGSANFTIPAGSSTVTKTLQLTSVDTDVSATLGATSSAANPATCTFTSCLYTAKNSGFWFNVPDHVAATTQAVTIDAVRKDNNTNACVPAFANVSKTVQMGCTYGNPGTGFWPVLVNGSALNPGGNPSAACASANPVTLNFDGGGRATANISYADVGRMSLTVAYAGSAATGDDGLSMNGTDTFIAAPKDMVFSGIPAAPLTAGTPFNATVTVRNNAGNATPNFGREDVPVGVLVTSSNPLPALGNATAINDTFSGFANGQVSRNIRWDEVGTINLNATVNSYLGSGLNASGALTEVGRFKPAYFKTDVTQGCVAGAYTYSGQPFPVRTTAYAAVGTVTANYAGNPWAKTTTLSAVPTTTGALSNGTLADTDFTGGVSNRNVTFTFTTPQTVPQSIAVRAQDTDGVTSAGVASGEGHAALRSGRLVVRSNYGSELLPLILAAETQFWQEGGDATISTDDYWTVNTADTCSTLVAAHVGLSNHRPGSDPGLKAGETSISGVAGISGGRGSITLAAPGATNSGSVDITLDTAALAMGLPWLTQPPAARATFGLRRTSVIHLRENF